MNKLGLIVLTWTWAAQRWTFDLLSALVGAAVTAGLAILIYIYRKALGRARQSIGNQARQLLDKLAAGEEARYYDGLLNYLSTFEVLPQVAPLVALYIAPRFVTPQASPSLAERASLPPRVILGPVWQATRRLLVPGQPGIGRTALLIHLARTFIEQNLQGTYEPGNKHIPIYVRLNELSASLATGDNTSATSGNTGELDTLPDDDPAALLATTVKSHASLLIAGTLDKSLRRWLNSNQALVLLDGLDELSPPEQKRIMIWISKLTHHYPEPRYVVATPGYGYEILVNSGFSTLPLAKWGPAEASELARRWVKVNQGSDEDTEDLTKALKPWPGFSPLPIDLFVAALVWQKNHTLPPTYSAIYNQAVNHLLQEAAEASHPTEQSPLSPTLSRAALGRLAATLLKEDRHLATRAEIEQTVAELLPSEAKLPSETGTLETKTEEEEEEPAGQSASEAAPSGKLPEGVTKAIEALTKSGLLVARGQNLYAYAHRRLLCYLGAWMLVQLKDIKTLGERLNDPGWTDVFEFCAGMINITPLVDNYLTGEDDLLHTRLWTAVSWAAAAPPDAKWRGRVLGEVARVWVQPGQPQQLREQAMLGLLSTRDKGLPYLFRQVMTHPDPQLRAQAVRSLGLLGREADLAELAKALQDPDPEVRAAAIRAVGSIPDDSAFETLVDALLRADELMRQAAAEALAEWGEKGIDVLKDAAKDDDLLVRRSAAYGLGAIGEPWAISLLTDMERSDPQWAVRSAATDALGLAQKAEGEVKLDLSPIKLDEQGWLIEWAATRGMSVGTGRLAVPVLMKALAEGETNAKLAAIHTLARIGDAEAIPPLRQALEDPEEAVRDAAWRTLAEISARTGELIPA